MPDLFDERPVTVAEMIRCVRRELSMRRLVYPGRIATGAMMADEAESELVIMAAIESFLVAYDAGLVLTTREMRELATSSERRPR